MEYVHISFNDATYPLLLKGIPHPPKGLYVRGNKEIFSQPCIAIVGTRKASGEGLELARKIARDLSEAGLVIVSGLAQGIDGAAHKGALEAGGKTIGVLGSSLEERFFFPSIHMRLAKEMIEKGGAIVSEYEKNTPALKQNFVARNRIVSGLSLGVLVVEAPIKSGALITANFAKKQKRLAFAIPGSPFSKNSGGANLLIKQGAYLVERAKDVLEILEKENFFHKQKGKEANAPSLYENMSAEEKNILDALAYGQLHIDKLAKEIKVGIEVLLHLLLELELKGSVKNIGGGIYVVVKNYKL